MSLSDITVSLRLREAPDGFLYLKTGPGGWQPLGMPGLHRCACGDQHAGIIPEKPLVERSILQRLKITAIEAERGDAP